MKKLERHEKILKLIASNSSIGVNELCELVETSHATIRRDLAELEEDGLLERYHGGAIISSKRRFEISFNRRSSLHNEEKQKIAKKALDYLREGDTIILDAGTTTLHIAKQLAKNEQHVRIITNSIAIAQETAECLDPKVTLLGGNLDWHNMSTIGLVAIEYLRTLMVDKVFIGANSVDIERGVFAVDESSAFLNRAMVSSSRQVIVVCDSSKFQKTASFKSVDLAEIDCLITDYLLDREIANKLCKKLNLVIAGE
jgi:DeoR family fructose operon transcriptional repressor